MMQRHIAAETPAGTLVPVTSARFGRIQALAGVTAPAVVLAAGIGWWALRGIDHRFISFSDGVYMYAASVAAAHGAHALYSAVALSLPPGALLWTAVLWKLSPHIEVVRLALAGLSVLTALLAYRVATRLFSLGPWTAALAAAVALTGPVQAQFVGVDGEAFLTPLALALALAIDGRRLPAATALLGVGFFFKLTWAPFFLAGVVALALRDGKRTALRVGTSALLVAVGLYALALQTFGWSFHDLLAQLVLAESRSDLQLSLLPGLVAVVFVLWWPLLLLARHALRTTSSTMLMLTAAGAVSALYMLKQGTFFNVLAPLEPFLAISAVAGGLALWRGGRRRGHAVLIVCSLAIAVHVASVSTSTVTRSLPFPLGAALVDVDNQRTVDRIATAIEVRSRPDQPVLVNPLFALVAGRHVPGDAPDWFILHALQRYCGSSPEQARHCTDWAQVKALARRGRIPVVSVDKNVLGFDPTFSRDTNVASMKRVVAVKAPPITLSLYAR
jgi:hypothetical protein